MPIVIDDAAIAAAANEVGSAVESSCADGLSGLSEEGLSEEFAPETFQKVQECAESSNNTLENSLEKEFSEEKFSEEPRSEERR